MAKAKALLALIAVLALGAQDNGLLTIDSMYHPQHRTAYVEPLPDHYFWRPDGTLLEERIEKGALTGIYRVSPDYREARPVLDQAQLAAALSAAGAEAAEIKEAGAGPLTWNPARDAFLVKGGTDLFLVEPATQKARRLRAGEAPAFSPDGARVAFLDGSGIRVLDLATGRDAAVTEAGDADHLNGRLDWIYQEEVFGERGNVRAFWWAPDSRRIAFLALDESPVPVFTIMDDRSQPQKAVSSHYPKAGDPLPGVRLGVTDLEGQTAWMEDPYPGQEIILSQVGWDPKGRLLAHYTDRLQSWLDCRVFEAQGSRVLVQERSHTWVDRLPLPHFLPDGRFLWLSARTGFRHLYLYEADGRLTSPVTAGDWDVRRLLGVDAANGKVYFEGTQRSAVGLDAYRADLAGVNDHLRRLTEAPGTHSLICNPAFTAAVDRWSDIDTPPQDLFLDAEGLVRHRKSSATTPAFAALRKGQITFQQVRTRDGFMMETMLVLPPGFSPARKYPVFHYVYGGPNTPTVRNAYSRSALWFQFLAQQGIVTWLCDNRSASGKGGAASGVFRNLGAQELADQLDGLAWLKSQPWVDSARIALDGYSYGGFLTAYAMTHSKAWKLGIIGAPVTDWRLYDCVYTERYMGLPKDNPQGYDAASPIKAAADLAGKVMFIHGTLDGNVHLQNTVQLLDALQKAGHSAPLTLLPGSDHSPRAPRHEWAMYEAIWTFLKANL